MNLKTIARGIVCLCVALFTTAAFAQTKVVTGKVTDSKDGSAIQGASILVKGTKIGTQTGADGTFKISVPASAKTLTISSLGYEEQQVAIQDNLMVALAATSQNLNDVVVIGYGTARKKDITGAVASLQSKDFNQGVITTPNQLLQNKVAGLEVTNNTGQPGGATTIKIRGNNSIRASNNPLYVIDGVPLDGRSARPGISTTFGVSPDADPLIFLNPNDIASIDVLKDASSTAIYGSRGANGVIVITTKTGSAGAPKLEFGTSIGFNAGLMKKFDVLSAGEFRSALNKYGITGQDMGSTVDAFNQIKNTNLTQNYSLAMSGGNENGRFRASFLGSSTNGYIKNSSLDKYVGNFAGQYKFLDKRLTLTFNLTAGHTTESLVPVANTSGSQGNIISSVLQWNPTQAMTDASGNFIYPTNGSGNPLAFLAATNDMASVNSILGNISASYKLSKNLEYKFMYALNNSTGARNTNLYGFLQGISGVSSLGFGAISNARLTSQTFDHTLTYKTDLTRSLHMDAVVGYEYWKSDYNNNAISASGFNTNLTQGNITLPYTSMLQDGNQQNLPSVYVDPTIELQSYFGRIQLNQSDKYYLTATLRADGSSKFGSNNKYGYFPSVGAKWAIINEDFMKNNKVFSNLGLRASWGITGNQEFPAGASQEQFNFNTYNNAGQTNVANPNLKWEQTNSYNFGIDFALKNGKIYGSIDYYNKNTTNILFQNTAIQPAPASIYFINLPANIMNSGVEFSLGATLIDKKDFTWDVNANISYNKNKLKNFTQNGKDLLIQTGQINGQGVSGTLGEAIANNQPVDVFYLKQFGGFDANGNQIIGANPFFAGNPNPTTNYGISTTLRYKKFTFVINGGGAAGYMVYNNTATSVTNISGIANGRNIDKNAYNSAEKPSSAVGASTRFLESGNFFKIRNTTLSYSIGNAGKYVKNLNAFVSATNLLVITKFSGFDPEVSVDKSYSNYPSRSIEYIPYPTMRTVTVGVNFSL
ncbi:MAG: SusC/RagA family TonB-linked outer membrane protein [Bacteroidota bacterium]|nr:SusC/RagA family TonB-linked outer membrane protein [Bacteroidota bacterium]